MDSLTHIVLGAVIGEAVLGKKIGKKAMLWGALADSLPDIDVLFTPFYSQIDGLFVHRGITHSFLFAIIISLVLGKLFARFNFKQQTHWTGWFLLFFLGCITHIFIDACTAYGTGWFEPFSNYRVSFNTIFVADLLYTLPLLVSFIALLILNSKSNKRLLWNRVGLILSTAYLIFTFCNKQYIDSKFEKALRSNEINTNEYFTTPTPLNNILWMCVAKKSEGEFAIGYYSLFDNSAVSFNYINKNIEFANGANEDDLQKLIRFSQGYFCITTVDDSSRFFNDMRFGQFPGWESIDAPFAFSFSLNNNKQSALNRGRFKGSIRENFAKLWVRIKGR